VAEGEQGAFFIIQMQLLELRVTFQSL
jgi:hypothetical protein